MNKSILRKALLETAKQIAAVLFFMAFLVGCIVLWINFPITVTCLVVAGILAWNILDNYHMLGGR